MMHSEAMILNITNAIEAKKLENGDIDGVMNYVPCLREMIIEQIKSVNKQISLCTVGAQTLPSL